MTPHPPDITNVPDPSLAAMRTKAELARIARRQAEARQALEVWAAWKTAKRRKAEEPTFSDVFGTRYRPLKTFMRDDRNGVPRRFVLAHEAPGPEWYTNTDMEYEPHCSRIVRPGSSVSHMALVVDSLVEGFGPDRYRAICTPGEVEKLLRHYPSGGVYEAPLTGEPTGRWYRSLIRRLAKEVRRIGKVPGKVLDAMPVSVEEGA